MLNDLIKLLEKYASNHGIPEYWVNDIAIYLIAISIIFSIFGLIKKFIKWLSLLLKQRSLSKDLSPFYSKSDVDRATRFYINSKYQNVAPSEDDEPGAKYIASPKEKLIPLFLKKVFGKTNDDNKFYLILADTGMGKTTSLINLYISYKNEITFFKKKYNIKLLPLGATRILDEIKKISDPSDTILLLDALDEDILALIDYKKRLNEILEYTWKFRVVIISCRTQFFPNEHEEPSTTGYFSHGESGEYKFQKLYLSVFDEKDIRKYLRKRFPILNPLNWSKLIEAKKIIKKCSNLIVRPMLLSHIEDIVLSDEKIETSQQLYAILIKKWLVRESCKPGIREKYGSEKEFEKLLYEFSKKLAVNIYNKKEKRGGFYISNTEQFAIADGLKLADIDSEDSIISDPEKRSKSLLNRNASGQYKFSHKSILEYYLSLEMINNPTFFHSFDFKGMDAASNFFDEMIFFKIRKMKGKLTTFDGIEKQFNNILFSDLKKTKNIQFENITQSFNYSCLTKYRNIKSIIITFPIDVQAIIIILENSDNFKNQFHSLLIKWNFTFLNTFFNEMKRSVNREVRFSKIGNYLKVIQSKDIDFIDNMLDKTKGKFKNESILNNSTDFDSKVNLLTNESFTEFLFKDDTNRLQFQDFIVDKTYYKTINWREYFLNANIDSIKNDIFYPLENLLSDIDVLTKTLPNCKIIVA